MLVTFTNALGEERTAETHPDERSETGRSASCPWCGGWRTTEECGNPMCEAGKWATPEEVLARREEKARRDAEAAERAERSRIQADATRRWREQEEERRTRELAEVREAGQCVECYFRHYGKRVRHRSDDFHAAA